MKTLYLETITPESGKVTTFFQVVSVERKTKKGGEGYLSLCLSDRTGGVDAKCWFMPEGMDALKAGDWVKVQADCGTYRDALQLKVSQIRFATTEDGIDRDDFMPVSKLDRTEMLQRLAYVITGDISDKHPGLKDALKAMVEDNKQRLHDVPAAKKLHQPWLGGLLEHIHNLIELAKRVSDLYPQLDRDILIAACIIHDIGKLEELTYETHIGYSRAGTLVGHIIQGSIIWSKYSAPLDPDTRDHLQHIIASHHGQLDWGAARVPMTLEAFIFHQLDVIDARIQVVLDALSKGVNAEGFTVFIPAMGTQLWEGGEKQPNG